MNEGKSEALVDWLSLNDLYAFGDLHIGVFGLTNNNYEDQILSICAPHSQWLFEDILRPSQLNEIDIDNPVKSDDVKYNVIILRFAPVTYY